MSNSADPDETAYELSSGSTLFAKVYIFSSRLKGLKEQFDPDKTLVRRYRVIHLE